MSASVEWWGWLSMVAGAGLTLWVAAGRLAAAARLRDFMTAQADLTDWSDEDGPFPTGEADHGQSASKGMP